MLKLREVYSSIDNRIKDLESQIESNSESIKELTAVIDFCGENDYTSTAEILNNELESISDDLNILAEALKDALDERARDTDAEVNYGVND